MRGIVTYLPFLDRLRLAFWMLRACEWTRPDPFIGESFWDTNGRGPERMTTSR